MTLYFRNFPDELHRQLKIKAATDGTTIKALCIEILSKAVEKKEKPKPRRRAKK